MNTILVIDSAVSGEASVSKTLVREAVDALTAAGPARVIRRDLGRDPVPHLTEANRRRRARRARHRRRSTPAAALSDALIAELRAADTIVIGAPMYNFSVPTGAAGLVRPRAARRRDLQLFRGRAARACSTGKRVIVVESRGGLYSEGPAQALDFQEPYLRHLLGFMGLTDVTFVRAEKIGYGPEARAEAIAAATSVLRALSGGIAAAA